ncbi:MAG: sulfite reductase subunit alpha [Pseudomarimonas sp.]
MSTASRAIHLPSRALLLNLLALALLCGAFVLLLGWQSASWEWSSDARRWQVAGLVLAAYLAPVAGFTWRRRRRRHLVDEQPWSTQTWPVVFASQTGQAHQLANRTANTMRQAGVEAQVVAINQVDAARLQSWSQVLFVVSTTGEGDAPDAAAEFVRQVLSAATVVQPLNLWRLRYGVLALGDREYTNFCGFGYRLDHWLRQQGAQPLFDLIDVDNGDEGALRHWQHHLGQLTGQSDLPDWQAPQYRRWQLVSRRHLNPGSEGGAIFDLTLRPEDPSCLSWEAGDIAEVGPRNAPQQVAEFITAAGLDGSADVGNDTAAQSLFDRLARSRLPTLESLRGLTPLEVAQVLTDLPHREYSVASIPAEGVLRLLVRQLHHPDGSLGLGGAWLTVHAPIGASIDLRLRANTGFRLDDDARPLILIGNGSGISGLRALLQQRFARGQHRNWLLFGERHAARDDFYGEEIHAALANGQIARLDHAWSRDHAQRFYVQDRLREAADELRRWVSVGAAIYVCGSLQGMAPGVDAALRDILGADSVERLADAGRYRRDVY